MTRLSKTPIKRNFGLDWYSDLNAEDNKELRTQLINGSVPVLTILAGIVERRRKELERKYDYENYLDMAKDNGRKQELDYLLKLLTPTLIKE